MNSKFYNLMRFIIETLMNSTHNSQHINLVDGLPYKPLEPRSSFEKIVLDVAQKKNREFRNYSNPL